MIKFVGAIFILAVFTEAASALSPEEQETLRALDTKINLSVEKCTNSSERKDENIRYILMAGTPLNRKAGCFFACVAKELDLVTDKNMLDKDKINKFLEPAKKSDNADIASKWTKANKIIDDCLATQEGDDDVCEAAKTIAECTITKFKAEFLH